jgi:hypothetical protein
MKRRWWWRRRRRMEEEEDSLQQTWHQSLLRGENKAPSRSTGADENPAARLPYTPASNWKRRKRWWWRRRRKRRYSLNSIMVDMYMYIYYNI